MMAWLAKLRQSMGGRRRRHCSLRALRPILRDAGLLLFLSPARAVLRARSERVLGVGGNAVGAALLSATATAHIGAGLPIPSLVSSTSQRRCIWLLPTGLEPAAVPYHRCELRWLGGLCICHHRCAGAVAQCGRFPARHVLHNELLRAGRHQDARPPDRHRAALLHRPYGCGVCGHAGASVSRSPEDLMGLHSQWYGNWGPTPAATADCCLLGAACWMGRQEAAASMLRVGHGCDMG